jgi:aerobic C4-dicarboxylate transport protein
MSEGRALTNCIGNGVATMVISRWQGERDEERFQAALRDPREVERITDLGLDDPRRIEDGAGSGDGRPGIVIPGREPVAT